MKIYFLMVGEKVHFFTFVLFFAVFGGETALMNFIKDVIHEDLFSRFGSKIAKQWNFPAKISVTLKLFL